MKTIYPQHTRYGIASASRAAFDTIWGVTVYGITLLLFSMLGAQAQLRPTEVWRAVYDTSYEVGGGFYPVDNTFWPPLSIEEDGQLYFYADEVGRFLGPNRNIVQCTPSGTMTTLGYEPHSYWAPGVPFDPVTARDVDGEGRKVWTVTREQLRSFTFPNQTTWDHRNSEIMVTYNHGSTNWSISIQHPEVLGQGTSAKPYGARDYATLVKISENGDVLVVGRYGYDNGTYNLTVGSILVRLRAADGQELWRKVDTSASPNVCLANDRGDLWICGHGSSASPAQMVRYDEFGTLVASGMTVSGPLAGAVDAAGNLALAERYAQSDYDYNSLLYEHDKIRVVKYSTNLVSAWETVYPSGTFGPDIPHGLAFDRDGNLLVFGATCRAMEHRWDSQQWPVEECNHRELLALKYNAMGTLLWDSVFPSNHGYVPTDFAIDSQGNGYVCALQDFPYTPPETWGWAAVRFAGENGDVEWSLQDALPNPPTPVHGISGIAVDNLNFVYLAGTGGSFQNTSDHGDVVIIKCEQIETPVLGINPISLTATCNEGTDAPDSHFDVWNGGGGGAMEYVITENLDWLNVTPGSGSSTGELDRITVTYSSSGLSAGTYNGMITVNAPGAAGSPREIDVTLIVAETPQLVVSTNQLSVVYLLGRGAPPYTFEVWNGGSSNLNYVITENLDWLSCNPTSGTSTGEHHIITVQIEADSLLPGMYEGSLTITAAGAIDSPQTVLVSLVVNAAPILDAGPDQNVDEGDEINLGESYFEDLDPFEGHTTRIFWGDGTGVQPGQVEYAAGTGKILASHVYADMGSYYVYVELDDVFGTTATDSLFVVVDNVAPVVDAGADQVIFKGALASLTSATFSDAGTLDTHTATIDWGDGTEPDDGVITENPFGPPGATNGANGTVSGSHLYAEAGTYTATLRVIDDDGGIGRDEVTVTVQPQGPGSDIFIELETLGDALVVSWPGGQGVWLEKSVSLSDASWHPVQGSEGVSEMILPLDGEAGFYRVAVNAEALLITQQPISLALDQNSVGLLSVATSASGSVVYQWRHGGTSIPGATNSTLSIEGAQPSDVGDYSVVISRGLSSMTSSVATIVLLPPYGNLVWMPAGTFLMGSPAGEQDRDEDEDPITEVTLNRGFWAGTYEVTQQEYLDVMGRNPSHFTNSLDQPVEFLSWEEATNYCHQLTLRERSAGRIPVDHEYRLPTEAEWEYACRAGTGTRFSHGDDPDYSQLLDYAWIETNSGATTHRVGEKLPNPWGLYDLYGNAWEWCQDWYGASYPGGSVADPIGPPTGDYRIVRGGSYFYGGAPCRSANRGGVEQAGKRWDVGFRVVLIRER